MYIASKSKDLLTLHQPLPTESYAWLNLTNSNSELNNTNLNDTSIFEHFINEQIGQDKQIGIGGWLENRAVYHRSPHFTTEGTEVRNIHLGLDFWVKANTPICAPREATIHSLANNNNYGDYGPTIILEHEASNSQTLYTLYGHLSLSSLSRNYIGKKVNVGEVFASVGNYPINGDWPPHLHFQVMNTMLNKKGDFPGVCSFKDLSYYKKICQDPLSFLGIKELMS